MNNDPLKAHLDAAYRLAQALTLDPEAAADLTEAAFRAAYSERPETWAANEVRDRLLRHVLQANMGQERPPDALDAEAPPPGHHPVEDEFRARVAREQVERLLPTALASLPDRMRTVLLLVDAEGLSVSDAARILDRSPESLQAELRVALSALENTIFRMAGAVEREVFTTGLQDDWLRLAVARYTRSRRVPTPPTINVHPPRAPEVAARGPIPTDPGARAVVRRTGPRTILVGLLFILAAGLFGYLASSLLDEEETTSIVQLSAEHANAAELDFSTSIPAEAEAYLLEHTGRRLRVPLIHDATLTGVGVSEVRDRVPVPVLIYRDRADDQQITVYGYSYALLDEHPRHVTLERDVMQHIESEDHFDLHDLGDHRVLIWRRRDEIFVAVTRGDADELKDRIINDA